MICRVLLTHNTNTHYRSKIGRTQDTTNSKNEEFELYLKTRECIFFKNKINQRRAKFLLAKDRSVFCRVLLTHNTSTHYRSKRAHARHDKLKK